MNEDNNRTAISSAYMESNDGNGALGKEKTPRFNSPVNIRVISYRKARHDTEGVSIKAVLDGIVRAGILADDSSEQVKKVTFESRKTKKGEKEKTIIEIDDGLQ